MITPNLQSVPAFYQGYVAYVKHLDLFEALQESGIQMQHLLRDIPEEMGAHRYEVGKWSLKEVLCHIQDAERIFAYRALRFSRNDKTPLHGFEEGDYAPQANAENRTIKTIAEELETLRTTTIDLYKSFSAEMLERTGTANKVEVSVTNLGFITAGHEWHHRQILMQRYLTIA